MGAAIIPIGVQFAGQAENVVKAEVSKLVSSIVGVFDPGKARDAQREARAEMWYQLALKGSSYAGRHVLGGRTMVYTVKEKGYYETRWNELLTSNPRIAQLAQQLGGMGIPDNPTDAEQTQMAQEIQSFNDYNPAISGLSPAMQGIVGASMQGSGPAPVAPLSPAAQQAAAHAQPLPASVTLATPPNHWKLYAGIGAAVLLVIVLVMHERK